MTDGGNTFNAAGPMLGYLFQCRQALLLAVELTKSAPSLSISIEKFDDIAVEDADAPIAQYQLKHSIKPGSLTDTSIELWKTLRIWSEQVRDNPQLPFETRFSIFTTATAAVGSAAALLRSDRSASNENSAMELLNIAANTSKNEESKKARSAYLALPLEQRRALVAAINVFDQAPNISNVLDEIRDRLTFATSPQHLQTLVEHLEGWWFANVVRSLTKEGPRSLSLLAVRSKIDELGQAFRQNDLILAPGIDEVPEQSTLAADSLTFVQQMRRVNLQPAAIDIAKRDFYRATTQRSQWVRENALLNGEAQQYDDALVERWRRECLAQSEGADLSTDEQKQAHGRNIFHWANRSQVPFRNRHEIWLTTGSYQVLADSIRVGWHPDFVTLFTPSEDE
jgi:hypothetical protein